MPTTELIIVGAGGFGREVYDWASDAFQSEESMCITGFLDANGAALQGFDYPVGVLGDPLHFQPQDHQRFICALGTPRIKLRVCRDLQIRGAQFITLIHPSAVTGSYCRIGYGSVLCPGAILTTNITLGEFVTVNLHSTVGHDATIGDGCTLSAHCDVTGFAQMREGAFLGSHASVLPKAIVGEYATVGAGSVVIRRVRPHTTVMGVPAKVIAVPTETESGSESI